MQMWTIEMRWLFVFWISLGRLYNIGVGKQQARNVED